MKKFIFILLFLFVCSSVFGQTEIEEKSKDYWVYVRLEDRSGVTIFDDAGRSKAGDIVDILPVTSQYIPSEVEKKSYMIYKTALTESQKQEMLQPWIEEIGETKDGEPILETKAYRKNKLDTSKLGVDVNIGLITDKIDSSKIELSVKTLDDLSKYELKRKFYAYIQRPIIKLSNIITKKAWAETVSTINKSGEDYNTLALWEDAVDGDLVTATTQPTALIYDDEGTLDGAVVIDGSTTNSSYYMKISVPSGERHSGVLPNGTSGDGVVLTKTSGGTIITLADDYSVVEWVALKLVTNGNDQACIITTSNYSLIQNVIMTRGEESLDRYNRGILVNAASITTYVYNSLCYDFVSTEGSGYSRCCVDLNIGTGTSVYIKNFTAVDTECAFNSKGSMEIKNTISYNCSTDFRDGGGASYSGSNNASDGTISFGSDNQASKTLTFLDSDNDDYHLASTETDCIDKGVDLSGTFTTDIDGETRSGTWDIGADEYVSSVSSVPQIIINVL